MKNLIRVLTALLLLIPSLALAGGETDVGIVLSSGATEKAEYSAAASLTKGNLTTWARYYYTEHEGEQEESKGSAGADYDYPTDSPLTWWAFEHTGTDWAQGIRFENQAGAGPKYTLVDNKKLQISLSAGYLYHTVDYYGTETTAINRASIRPKAQWQTGRFDLRFVGYYQPRLDDYDDDYILKSTASCTYWIWRNIGMKITREDEYRSVSMVDDKDSARTSLLFTSRW